MRAPDPNVDPRGEMRQRIGCRRRQPGLCQQPISKLEHLNTVQRPRHVLGLGVSQASRTITEHAPSCGEKVVAFAKVISFEWRPDVDDDP